MRLVSALLLLLVITAAVAEDLPSLTGYYEGHVNYGAQFMRDRKYMTMSLACESDFWFVVDEGGNITGEGDATYDFAFSVSWNMAADLGITAVEVLGAALDPKVTLTLDPTTARQHYRLTGRAEPPPDDEYPGKLTLRFSWTDPARTDAKDPELKLNLVGSVGAEDATSARETLNWTPVPPFGQDKSEVPLSLRSQYGPYAASFHYDGSGTSAATAVAVDWSAVQEIDFAAQREIARLRAQVEELRRRAGL